MRIHRIALRNYRGVTEASVSLPASGITVIEGPNEVGKSSLVEALRLLFDYRDTSTDKRVRAVAPTHGGASPEATVELSTGPYRVTYTKVWHRKHGTTSLTISEPVREQVHGRAAHERMEAILAETLDRPLWDALRAEQGAALDGGGLANARSLSRALDLAAGGATEVDETDGLWERIEAERDRYWYATGKPRAEGVALERAVAEATAQIEAAKADLAGLDRLTDEANTLDAAADELRRRVIGCAERLTQLTERADAVASARAQVQSANDALAAARAEEAHARAQRHQRVDLVGRATKAADAVEAAERSSIDATSRRERAEVDHGAATEALEGARRLLSDAETTHRLATDDRDHARQQIEVDQLTERLQGIGVARAEVAAADRVLASNQVTAEHLRAIDDAHLELVGATAAAEVSATTIETVALAPIEVTVDGRTIALGAEERHQLAVAGRTELVVPGVARIVVQAGVEAGERAERRRVAEAQLRARCEQAGVTDRAAARSAAAARADAESTRSQAEAAIARNRRDLTEEALHQKVDRLTARIAAYAARRPGEPPPPPDLTEAQAHAAQTEDGLAQARAFVARQETAHQRTDRGLRSAELAASGVVAELEAVRRTARQEHDALVTARADVPDETLDHSAASTDRTRATAERSQVEAQEALRRIDPDGTEGALAHAGRAETEARRAEQEHRARREELRIQLDVRGEDGLSERADRAATTYQHAVGAYDGWRRRADAARHLHAVFAARRVEIRRRYEAPLAERIQELGRLVFGPTLQVDLDADLAIRSRTVDGTTVAFDQLSTGAREQLGLLSRLACATLVDPDDGVPVVLDDVLGWTDPTRLQHVAAAINAAGRDAQVILLTCTPERFAAIEEATVVHLGPEPEADRNPNPTSHRPRRRPDPGGEPTLFPVEERPAS